MPVLPRAVLYAMLAGGLLFVLGGGVMIYNGVDGSWPGFLFFGMCSAVAVSQLWPNILRSDLTRPSDLLRRFPGPVELAADRTTLLLLLAGAAIFVGVFLWMLQSRQIDPFWVMILWLGVLFFGVSIPVCIFVLVRGAPLRLQADGFWIAAGWKNSFTRWADASAFEVATVATSGAANLKMVVFDSTQARNSRFARYNVSVSGRNSGLLSIYGGLSHDDLAWLLNQWRERALAADGPKSGSA